MTTDRLPWEIVETLPQSDRQMLAEWERRVAVAANAREQVQAWVGRALTLYWAGALGVIEEARPETARRRRADVDDAEAHARRAKDPDLVATALLGRLYACWGPPDVSERAQLLLELEALRPSVVDPELRARIVEWRVLQCFDTGRIGDVRPLIDEFLREASHIDSPLFTRREILWRANLEMLEGRLEEAVQLNVDAVASTADIAGSPSSFQNVAITTTISMYFTRDLADVIDAIQSIRASSARVEANWEVGLAFALSEVGDRSAAQPLFDELARDHFVAVPDDLNWLVAMELLGLVAVNLDDRPRATELLGLLRPYAEIDGTHGSGYASYGPVGRVVGLLAEAVGESAEAEVWFDYVLSTREPGPWTTLARADRAQTRRGRDPVGALADAEHAEREFRAFGLVDRANELRRFATEIRLDGHGGPVAELSGGWWTLTHPTGRAHVLDGIGMQTLSRLLNSPGEPIDAVDLDPRVDAALPRASVTESTLDRPAKDAYRRRCRELEALTVRSESQNEELDFLQRELAGSAYPAAASKEIEKARVRVTVSIRRAIDAIAGDSPGLGEHLRTAIATGRRCSYQPADGAAWRVER